MNIFIEYLIGTIFACAIILFVILAITVILNLIIKIFNSRK